MSKIVIVLIGLAIFALFVLFFVSSIKGLHTRISELEARIRALEGEK